MDSGSTLQSYQNRLFKRHLHDKRKKVFRRQEKFSNIFISCMHNNNKTPDGLTTLQGITEQTQDNFFQ